LIIKIGAAGDVVRTTPLLHPLRGKSIDWITDDRNREVLPQHFPNMEIISFDEAEKRHYALVLSLDEDAHALQSLRKLSYERLVGAFINAEGKYDYTDEMAEWFNMSLISKYGKEKADQLKFINRKTYQYFLFKGLGLTFQGETYIINEGVVPNPTPNLIGIERRAGSRWKTKQWNKYDELAEILQSRGFKVFFFVERPSLMEYMRDIARCGFIITGDTLCMHIAIALRIPTIGIFTCTSPWEIEDYGILHKVVSPLLHKAFYKTEYVHEAVDAISLTDVLNAFYSHYSKFYSSKFYS